MKNDLDSIMYGQNETGASAIEALRQLENERDGYPISFAIVLFNVCHKIEERFRFQRTGYIAVGR